MSDPFGDRPFPRGALFGALAVVVITVAAAGAGRFTDLGRSEAPRAATVESHDLYFQDRNDGAVEAMVQGSPEAVARMLAWARHGPRSARVDRVEVEPGDGEYTAFEARDSS